LLILNEVKRLELCIYQHLSLVGEMSAMEEQVKYFEDGVTGANRTWLKSQKWNRIMKRTRHFLSRFILEHHFAAAQKLIQHFSVIR